MTVQATGNTITYSANGATTTFAFPFRLLDASHISVWLKDANGVWTACTYGSQYTVNIIGVTANVVFTVAPSAGTSNVRFIRSTPYTQLIDYVANDSFPAQTHELGLDKLTLILQDLFSKTVLKSADGSKINAEGLVISNASTDINDPTAVPTNASIQAAVTSATASATAAATSATAAATSESNAATSESAAAESETAAATSEANAAASATAALASQNAASVSETNAATSATSASNTLTQMQAAYTGIDAINTAVSGASASANAAAASATAAAGSAAAAGTSETNTATSEANAAASETAAETSAASALTSRNAAAASQIAAATSEANAAISESSASQSAAQAALSAEQSAAGQVNADWNATSGKAQILNKPDTLAGYGVAVDAVPTEGSANPVTSDGVKTAIDAKDALPAQAGNADKFLKTDGTQASWESIRPDSGVPIGTIEYFATATPPVGYLIANGAAVGRTTYPELFSAINTTFGAGDGSTTFNLPDLINRFAQGSHSPGQKIEAGLPNITGTMGAGIQYPSSFNGALYNSFIGGTKAPNADATLEGLGFDASRSNPIYGASDTVQPPALTLLPCIKAFDAATNPGLIDITELANEMAGKVDAKDALPAQAGNADKFLKTDGTQASWASVVVSHGMQVFTESGTFTVPEGVTRVFVYMCGGGGCGFSTSYSQPNGESGGTSTFGSYAAAPGGEGAYMNNSNSNARRDGYGGASGWATTPGFSSGIGGLSGSNEVFAFSEGMWVWSQTYGGGGIGNFSGGSGGAVAFELDVSPGEQIPITIGAGGARTGDFGVAGNSGVCFVRY